jgi:NAD(P)-dependent dehydrogenase (short-subunit alcohol dehydrogenase family)
MNNGNSGSKRFDSQLVVITGSARGIGAAYARAFIHEGATVVIADVDSERATSTANMLGDRALALHVDVSREDSVADLFKQVETRWGRVDCLINNAALMLDVERPFKPFWEIDWTEWQRYMAVNAGGVFLCCKHAYPLMAHNGRGSIVNITSDAIWQGYIGQLAYFASKGAIAVMTRCLARELGEFNITVNAVAPGLTSSESVIKSEFLQQVKPVAIQSRPLKRDQMPEDLVGAVLFLCAPENRCITGQTIVVNCGSVMP